MVDSGRRFAVLEATSHGLSERTSRLRDVQFAVGALTNLSHEHLEFHGSFEEYRSDKANLFRSLSWDPDGAFGVLNLDDPSAGYFRAQTRAPVFGYSLRDPAADLSAVALSGDLEGSSFELDDRRHRLPARLHLPGVYNVQNLLAAALAVLRLLDLPLEALAPHLEALTGVPGRMQRISAGQPFQVIVDYAHTPGAFDQLLPLLRRHCSGRLIAVFGSAGERDVAKRALQGALAARLCDEIILTDEDPRGEDRLQILEEIASGARSAGKEPAIEPDRRQAIRRALSGAAAGDTVALLGKGHEKSILYPDGPLPWDEARVAAALLAELGFSS
jgi:UDP-N-acetylmuramoyl-L-alanyl-D-glutamate--2,6-diaminopimelate ligase